MRTLFPSVDGCEGELFMKPPDGPGVGVVVGAQLPLVPQDAVQVALPVKPHVWYPSGTGMEFVAVDCHIKKKFAVNMRL